MTKNPVMQITSGPDEGLHRAVGRMWWVDAEKALSLNEPLEHSDAH